MASNISGIRQTPAMIDLGVKPRDSKPSAKTNYTNNSRNNIKAKSPKRLTFGDKIAVYGSRFSMGLAGAAFSIFALGKIASVLGTFIGLTVAGAAGAAVAVTPFGWAALGLAAVGLGILAARHLYMKCKNIETDTGSQLIKSGVAAVCGFGSIAAAALCIWAFFEGAFDTSSSDSNTASNVATSYALYSLADTGAGGSDRKIKSEDIRAFPENI